MNRPTLLLCFAFVFFSSWHASAQLDISAKMSQYRYLLYEPVSVTVTLRNNTGNHLRFVDGAYLRLELRNVHGRTMAVNYPKHYSTKEELNPIHGLFLPSGATKSLDLPIHNFCNLQKPGEYELRIRVGHPRMRNDFRSRQQLFVIQQGNEVWSKEIGVPNPDSEGEIGIRRISILVFRADDADLYMMKIEDDDYVHAVARLGPHVTGLKPQIQIDALSHIHTLVQEGPRHWNLRIFDLNGKQNTYRMYMYDGTNPRLIYDPDLGRVMVSGGRLAVDGVDFNIGGQRLSEDLAEIARGGPGAPDAPTIDDEPSSLPTAPGPPAPLRNEFISEEALNVLTAPVDTLDEVSPLD
ncbi:MAG: hypothetical protein ACI8W8_000330 [Rhodothermales bacterium]|jgi:hypothetical protein